MNATLLDRFEQAYHGSTVDQSAVKATYTQWIDFKLKDLGGLPGGIRDEVVSGMVAERARAIAAVRPEARPAQLTYDRIWTELWPIDKASEALAQLVKEEHTLSDQDRATLQADQQRLAQLKTDIRTLPPDLQHHFGEAVSETMLDLAYALHNGSGPMSMRLGRED
jgi:hypothetical protein